MHDPAGTCADAADENIDRGVAVNRAAAVGRIHDASRPPTSAAAPLDRYIICPVPVNICRLPGRKGERRDAVDRAGGAGDGDGADAKIGNRDVRARAKCWVTRARAERCCDRRGIIEDGNPRRVGCDESIGHAGLVVHARKRARRDRLGKTERCEEAGEKES